MHRVLPHEEFDQLRQLIAPLSKWRQRQANHVQPEEQGLAESSFCHRALEVPLRRGNDPHVDADGVARAETREATVLEDALESQLKARRQLADAVQEERSVVCELEPPGLMLPGARNGAALTAEQLGLEHLGKRRAINLDERTHRVGRTRCE